MKMESVNPFIPTTWQKTAESSNEQNGAANFGSMLKQAIHDVNSMQVKADDAAVKLASGQAEDVHQVMIAVEQAMLAMQLTVQIRNKAVEAYQEISRMQI